jgi:hypothetical protein
LTTTPEPPRTESANYLFVHSPLDDNAGAVEKTANGLFLTTADSLFEVPVSLPALNMSISHKLIKEIW